MGNDKNVKWVEGLRGLASVSVVATHLFRGFDYAAFRAADEKDVPPSFWQLPLVRTLPQGRIGVAIFAFLTGFVCSLKPLRLVRAGEHGDALTSIAKSAFRRIPRLIMPSTLIAVVAWFLAQLDVFHVAHHVDSDWHRAASPRPSPNAALAVLDLVSAVRENWTTGWLRYDPNQWAMFFLLRQSMLAYISLCATIFMSYKWRAIVYAFMYWYRFLDGGHLVETFALQLYFAMLICDFSLSPTGQAFLAERRLVLNIISPFLVVAGLYLASYPSEGAEWVGWSRQLHDLGYYIFPEGSDFDRRYTALGLDIIIVGLFFSSWAKDMLSNRFFTWLGANSFAVYLLHGTLMRTVLIWMLYGFKVPTEYFNEQGELVGEWIKRPGFWGFAVVIPAWLVLLYGLAHLWTTYVDAYCATLAQKLEKRVFKEDYKQIPMTGP